MLTDVFRWIHLQSNRNTFEIGGNQCDESTIAYTYPILFSDIHIVTIIILIRTLVEDPKLLFMK